LRKACRRGKEFALAGKKSPAQTVRQAKSPPRERYRKVSELRAFGAHFSKLRAG